MAYIVMAYIVMAYTVMARVYPAEDRVRARMHRRTDARDAGLSLRCKHYAVRLPTTADQDACFNNALPYSFFFETRFGIADGMSIAQV